MSKDRHPPMEAATLAEAVAHELNNIGASLFGFVELAAEAARAHAADTGWLQEIRVGVERITTVATVLEALAGARGAPAETALGDCLADGLAAGEFALRWRCDPQLRVLADPDHVRRALKVLVRAAPAAGEPASPASFLVAPLGEPGACRACGAALGAEDVLIAGGDGAGIADSPSRSGRRAETGLRRLLSEASAHAAHLAGGHVPTFAHDATRGLVLLRAAGHSSTTRGK